MQVVKNSFLICKFYEFADFVLIDYFEVYEEFREKGFGSMFIKDFIEKNRKKELSIRVVVLDENVISFWEKLGFKRRWNLSDEIYVYGG